MEEPHVPEGAWTYAHETAVAMSDTATVSNSKKRRLRRESKKRARENNIVPVVSMPNELQPGVLACGASCGCIVIPQDAGYASCYRCHRIFHKHCLPEKCQAIHSFLCGFRWEAKPTVEVHVDTFSFQEQFAGLGTAAMALCESWFRGDMKQLTNQSASMRAGCCMWHVCATNV
jgi:hypothetical protein